jgi:outer membrane autotransporter protein
VEAGNALQRPFWNAIFQHMHDSRPAAKQRAASSGGAWFSAFLGSGLVAGDSATAGSAKLKSQVSGFSAGADWPISSRLSLGGAVSIGNNKFHLSDSLGSGTNTSVQAAAYGFIQASKLVYGAFAASLSFNDFSTDRALTVSGTDRLTGSPKSYAIGGRYETGINLKGFIPYLAFEDTLVSISSYTETASSGLDQFALHYAARTQNLASLELGARQSTEVRVGSSWNLKLFDRLAVSHAFSESSTARARFEALPDSNFVVQGAKAGRDAILLTLGANLMSDAGFGLNLQLDSAVSSRSQSYVGLAGASYRW